MLILMVLGLLGHGFAWVALINRTHSMALAHWLCHGLTAVMLAAGAAIPLVYAAGFWTLGSNPLEATAWLALPWAAKAYASICWLGGLLAIAGWIDRRIRERRLPIERLHRRTARGTIATSEAVEGNDRGLPWMRVPGNQILNLETVERVVEVPWLSPGVPPLSILHLSDLHFTGQVGSEYFKEVVRLSNDVEADLIAVTGDIVDDSRYIDWVPETLGKLRARGGVYFVLGNHDWRHDAARLRQTMGACGLIDLGGRWMEVEAGVHRLVLAGNELPWFSPAADLSGAPAASIDGGPPRVLLAHGPDQISWARSQQCDLMLAGHNHGGQVCLPVLGPIFSPSLKGVRYAGGLYQEGQTLLHVSRGVSAEIPLRMRCMPEIVTLILTPAARPIRTGHGGQESGRRARSGVG